MIEGFDEDFLPAGWIAQDALSRKRFPNYTRLAKSITRVEISRCGSLNISFGVRSTTDGGRSRPPSSGAGAVAHIGTAPTG